jgi:hypothetical protein
MSIAVFVAASALGLTVSHVGQFWAYCQGNYYTCTKAGITPTWQQTISLAPAGIFVVMFKNGACTSLNIENTSY